jgi:hypothetical protein
MTMFTRNDKVSDLDIEHKVHESGSARVSAPTQEVPGRQARAAKGGGTIHGTVHHQQVAKDNPAAGKLGRHTDRWRG